MAHTASLEAAVRIEGLPVQLRVGAGRLHIDGAFAGNIDVMVISQPLLPPKAVLEALAIRTDQDPEPITAMAYESFPDGRLEITFHSPTVLQSVVRPDHLELWWGTTPGQNLGRLPMVPVGE